MSRALRAAVLNNINKNEDGLWGRTYSGLPNSVSFLCVFAYLLGSGTTVLALFVFGVIK